MLQALIPTPTAIIRLATDPTLIGHVIPPPLSFESLLQEHQNLRTGW
jgi:hypothetical protein